MTNTVDILSLLDPEIVAQARRNVAEGKLISLRTVVGFKLFMGKDNPSSNYCLKKFLSAVIGKEVTEAVVINSEILSDFIQGKQSRMDVNCTFNGQNKADIEMQLVKGDDDQIKRAVYYASLLMAGALKKGEHYKDLPEVHQIFILDEKLIEDDEFYHSFMFRDENNNTLSENMKIHFIELNKLKTIVKRNVDSLNELEFWSIVFKYFDDKTVWSAITKTRRYTQEVTVINNYSIEISQDEIDAAIALSREKFLRDTWSEKKLAEEKALAEGREEGRVEGREEGREEQRLVDQVIIERLQAEIEALKKARV